MSASCSSPTGIGQWKGSASPAGFNCVYDEPCNPCITVADWDAKISKTEALLEDMKRSRNVARTQLNQIHDRLIQQVPPEIASHIFTLHVCDADGIRMSKYPRSLVLSSVCKKWREIAFSTPQIWASLVVYDHDEWDFPVHLAEQWLARSGQLLLDIKLVRKDPPEKPMVSAMKTMIEVICAYSKRWNSLKLDIPPAAFTFFKADKIVHPPLEYLEINCSADMHPTTKTPFNPDNIPLHPKRVNLNYIPPSLVLVGWKNIVDLAIGRISLTKILYALQQCPQVERLYIGGTDNSSITPTTPHTFYNLKCLRGWAHSAHRFFDSLTLPALCDVFWTEMYDEKADTMSLTSMLKRSACSLTKLHLSWSPFIPGLLDVYHLTDLLFELPSLRILQLNFRVDQGSVTNRTFFEHFLPDTKSSSGARTSGS